MYSYLYPKDGPVVEGLESYERVFAADQPEYLSIRTLVSNTPERKVMSRWTFTDEERKAIAEGADIFLSLLTFGGRLQPVTLLVSDKPNPDYIKQEFKL